MTEAPVSEIYASIQGEGPYTGQRQIFLRLAGCPLRCRYCDTPESLVARGHKRFSVSEVVARVVKTRGRQSIDTVSVTGGEPLVHAAFLRELLPILRKRGFRIHLETAGVHPKAMRNLRAFVDVVSMDMKLPSATGRDFWSEHKAFLKVAGRDTYVKIVLEKESKKTELSKACGLIKRAKPQPLLVLQPATALPGVHPPAPEQVADAYAVATRLLDRVLVMPQQHKIWSVR